MVWLRTWCSEPFGFPIADPNFVGAAISGSFLFVVGVANSIILYRIVKQRKGTHVVARSSGSAGSTQQGLHEVDSTAPPVVGDEEIPSANHGHMSRSHNHGSTLLMKIIGPVITFVDHPWKVSMASTWHNKMVRPQIQMYPVGFLFGFGKRTQTDRFPLTENGPGRVRYCIIDRDSRDICDSETWSRWQRYQTCSYHYSPCERFVI